MPFSCDTCGICCKNIQHIPHLKEFDIGNGICIHLVQNKCSIYENRPDICNVDKMYEIYFAEQYTLEDFYKLNESACKKLKENFLKS